MILVVIYGGSGDLEYVLLLVDDLKMVFENYCKVIVVDVVGV